MHNESSAKNDNYLAGISLLALITFVLQFLFRALDDNRLTSWEYVFRGSDASIVFLILAAGLGLAFFLSKISISERLYPVVLFAGAFSSAAFFWGEPEVIVDSSRYFTQAKHLELYGVSYFLREWGRSINAWTDMPLIPFLYGIVFRVFGESRIYIQIFTTILFSSSVVLTYKLGESLWNRETGLIAGACLLGMPYLLTQAPLMLVDVPAMFFLILAIVAFKKALEKGSVVNIVSAALSVTFAFYAKYSTWLMLSVLAVIFLALVVRESYETPESGDKARIFRTLCVRFVLIAGIAAILIGMIFLYKFEVFSNQMRLLIEYQKPGLGRWQETFASTFLFQIHPFITLSSVTSIYLAIREKDIRYAIIAWLIVLAFVMQIRRIRYIIMIFPMFALMAAYAIRQIRHVEIKRFLVLSAVISSLTVAVFGYLPFLQRISTVNLKYAGNFADSLKETEIEVFTLLPKDPVLNPAVSVPILDLFTGKKIIYDYDRELFTQPAEKIEKSPLRFTWEYENPPYYDRGPFDSRDPIILVISEKPDDPLPEELITRLAQYHHLNTFGISEEIFRYQTILRIYQKKDSVEDF
jgi:hypothetical protein